MKLDDNATTYLLANFTHQVINPLNGVLGTIDNILDGTVAQDKIPVRLKGVRGQLESTVSLIRNLAFFVQYTSENEIVKRDKMEKTCVIPQVIIEAAAFYQEQGRQRGVSIELQDASVQSAVKGNPDLLRQVFMNLFDNGVKYGLEDTILNIKYWIKKSTGDLIVIVEGPSIRFNPNEEIFELGVRGEAAKKTVSSGTGIGLHVCKLIVENVFGGKITAQHVINTRLTRFEIRIPNAFNNEKAKDKKVAIKNDTILLLDDEPQFLDWLVEYLESKDYKVEFATTLDGALNRLNGVMYRMVICDLSVPLSDIMSRVLSKESPVYSKFPGAYAAFTARNAGHRSRQVIVYSVHETAEIQELANRIGVQYVTKGRPHSFKEEITRILDWKPRDVREE